MLMTIRRLFTVSLFLFALLYSTAAIAGPMGKVVRVIDGRTVVVDLAGTQLPVRLAGIEIPQGSDPTGRSYESIARQFLEKELVTRFVLFEYDPMLPRTDSEGRALAQLYRSPDAVFVTREMIRSGIAVVSHAERCAFTTAFLDVERHARGAGAGYWNETGVAAPLLFAGAPNIKYLGTLDPEQVASAQRSSRTTKKGAAKAATNGKTRSKGKKPQQPIVVIVQTE
jgi:endonuclease YncB( thermonuclease family)